MWKGWSGEVCFYFRLLYPNRSIFLMKEETFTSCFPLAARGSACASAAALEQSCQEHGTWHEWLLGWETGSSRQLKGMVSPFPPAIFTFPLLFFRGWGGIRFKLEIPGFAAAVKIPGIATVILTMLRDTLQSKHMLFPALWKMQEQTRTKLIGK